MYRKERIKEKSVPFFFSFCTDEFINVRGKIIVVEEGYSLEKSDMFVYGYCMLTVE